MEKKNCYTKSTVNLDTEEDEDECDGGSSVRSIFVTEPEDGQDVADGQVANDRSSSSGAIDVDS